MITTAKQCLRNSNGTSTVELALVLPIGMFLMFGAIDSSLAFAEQLRVEAAAARAIEQITAIARPKTDYTATKTEAAAAAKVSASDTTVTFWLECNNIVTTPFEKNCPNNSDQIARFVKVEISGKFKPVINYGGFLTTDVNGFVRVQGDASVRIQ